LGFGIVRDTFPPERVPGALGMMGAVFGIGAGIGLPLSGVIVDHLDLQWLFWVNLISVPAAIAAHRLVPPSPASRRARIDWTGAAVLSGALGSLLLGLTKANDWGWGSTANVGLIGGGLLLTLVFLLVEARAEEPLIDLRVLREPAVAATNLTGLLMGVAMFVGWLLIPQIAEAPRSTGYGFGASATVASLILLPAALAQVVAGPFAGRLGRVFGFRAVLAGGSAVTTLAFAGLVFARGHEWEVMIAAALMGTGICLCFAAQATLVVAAVDRSDVGIATGINTVMRPIGGALGVAVATVLLTGHTIPGTTLATGGAYTAAFVMSGFAGLLSLGAALLVPPAAEPLALAIPATGS
jgi:MFS family permease